MALFRQFWTCMLFLMVAVIPVQAQTADCYVDNDNPQIEENNLPGQVVTTIVKGSGVTVTIDTANTEHPEFFEINGTQLILKHSLDYENTSAILVRLQCWRGDLEINTVDITVSVINLNDNSPVFKEANITVSINEDTKVNTIVVPQVNVTASDADLDTVFYNLTGSPPEATDYFNIQGVNNPAIYLRKALDYETLNFMQLTLYAMDGNAGEAGVHTATATITIHILQADLRPPWFQPCTFIPDSKVCVSRGYTGRVNISEMTTGPLNLKPGPLYAVDGDISLNEKIEYLMVDGNDNDTFSVNRDTGNITMNKPVNTLRTFLLYVMASQANNPFRFSQTTVEISVVRRNDHKPHFEKPAYFGLVSVGLPVSSLVMDAEIPSRPLRIFAADEDFPDKVNPDITYQIQNSTDFTVGQDGFLLTTVVLNIASTITLLAIADDTTTMEEASTLIIIDVTPLASATTVPTTTSTTTTTATPNIPTTRTTASNPSGSSITTGINNTLSTTTSGSSTISAANTTSNAGLTGSPGTNTTSGPIIPPLLTTVTSPGTTVNTSQSQTTRLPVTGVSQASRTSNAGVTGKPATTSGPIIPPLLTTVTSPGTTVNTSQSQTTRLPVTGVSQASRTSNAGVTGRPATTSGPIIPPLLTTVTSPGTTANTSQSQTTRLPMTGVSQASRTSNAGATGRPATTSGSIIPPLAGSLSTTRITSQSESIQPLTTTSRTAESVAHSSATVKTPQIAKSTTRSVTSASIASSTASLPNTQTLSTGPVSSPEVTAECHHEEKDMIILGATLGSLLAITLVLLLGMIYKYYKSSRRQKDGEDSDQLSLVSDNHGFQDEEQPDSGENDNRSSASDESACNDPVTKVPLGTPPPSKKSMESSQASSHSEGMEEGEEGESNHDSEKGVKSILSKDRRLEDDGYKAVWFKEDIGPEAKDDVMIIEVDNDAEQSRNDDDSDDQDAEDEGDHSDSGISSNGVSFIPGILSEDGPKDHIFDTFC